MGSQRGWTGAGSGNTATGRRLARHGHTMNGLSVSVEAKRDTPLDHACSQRTNWSFFELFTVQTNDLFPFCVMLENQKNKMRFEV
jgi:hypothetical protein